MYFKRDVQLARSRRHDGIDCMSLLVTGCGWCDEEHRWDTKIWVPNYPVLEHFSELFNKNLLSSFSHVLLVAIMFFVLGPVFGEALLPVQLGRDGSYSSSTCSFVPMPMLRKSFSLSGTNCPAFCCSARALILFATSAVSGFAKYFCPQAP